MLTTVKLYGHLGRKFGRRHVFNIHTVGEAVRAMEANYPGFSKYVIAHSEPGYHIVLGHKDLTVEQLVIPVSERVIRFIPVVAGAGKSPWVSIVIGVALIWATGGLAAVGMSGFSALAAGGAYAGLGAMVGAMGAAMVLGGVSQLLAGTPGISSQTDALNNRTAFGFDGPANTEQQGLPVPLCYGGPIRVGGSRISASVTIDDLGDPAGADGFRITNLNAYTYSYSSLDGQTGVTISEGLTATEGTSPYSWAIVADIEGLFTIASSNISSIHELSGGHYEVTISCTDSSAIPVTIQKTISFDIGDTGSGAPT